jgi:uncharacterized radical SAM protein YgiQ
VLLDAGYRVGIAAQPDWRDPESVKTFGRPLLGCGVASGNMDSMVKLYTAGRRLRHEDMYSPGGKTGLCPPHASVVYSQLVRQAFPGLPVILGGVEASLRRVAHYDYWQDKMRPSVLVDAKGEDGQAPIRTLTDDDLETLKAAVDEEYYRRFIDKL